MFRWRMSRHGRPPREHLIVVRIERPADVDEAVADDPLELRALLRELADRARLALLRVDVHVRARDVQIAADDEAAAHLRCASAANSSSAARNCIFAGKSLPPFGT